MSPNENTHNFFDCKNMTDEDRIMKKRVRSTNYTSEEKATLINIIIKYKNIIESKKTDKVSWKDKNDTWEKIKDEFNSIAPSGTYRTTESLKKFYENMKKETRKNAAQEKIELFKTGGGIPAHKVVDPMHESILTLMNTKTVEGFDNRFDSDTIPTTSLSDENNTFDVCEDVTNIMYIGDETDTDDCTMQYEVLDEVLKEITPDAYVNSSPCTSQRENVHKEKETKKTNSTSNWKTYTPDKLKTSKHEILKVTKTNVSENKENKNLLQTRRQRRPSTMALHSSHISKQYSDLAEIKMKLGNLQLTALKEEMAAKQKLNEMEFELKKKSLELDIQLKQAQLRKLHTNSLL